MMRVKCTQDKGFWEAEVVVGKVTHGTEPTRSKELALVTLCEVLAKRVEYLENRKSRLKELLASAEALSELRRKDIARYKELLASAEALSELRRKDIARYKERIAELEDEDECVFYWDLGVEGR